MLILDGIALILFILLVGSEPATTQAFLGQLIGLAFLSLYLIARRLWDDRR